AIVVPVLVDAQAASPDLERDDDVVLLEHRSVLRPGQRGGDLAHRLVHAEALDIDVGHRDPDQDADHRQDDQRLDEREAHATSARPGGGMAGRLVSLHGPHQRFSVAVLSSRAWTRGFGWVLLSSQGACRAPANHSVCYGRTITYIDAGRAPAPPRPRLAREQPFRRTHRKVQIARPAGIADRLTRMLRQRARGRDILLP